MDYNTFKEKIGPAFIQALPEHIRNMATFSVEKEDYINNAGPDFLSLNFKNAEMEFAVKFEVENLYEVISNGIDSEHLIEKHVQMIEKIYENHADGEVPNLLQKSFDEIKSELLKSMIPFIMNAKNNENILENMPHRRFLDLAVTYQSLKMTPMGAALAPVTNVLAERAGWTEEFLYDTAVRNLEPVLGIQFGRNLMGDYQIASKKGMFGAAGLLKPCIMDDIHFMLGRNFFLIPESMHRIVIVPDSFSIEYVRKLQKAENEILHSQDPMKYLSDSIYYYDAEIGKVLMLENDC